MTRLADQRSKFCATCGKPRSPLEVRRESWSLDMPTVLIPRRDDVDGQPWQQTNDLIVNAAVWRNGGTGETCHLCDDCLRIGLRRIKQDVDEALGIVEMGHDQQAELVRLTQKLASIQHEVREVEQLRAAGIPWYAWNHTPFLRAVAMLWSYYMEPEPGFLQRFPEMTDHGEVRSVWTVIRDMLDAWQEEVKE